MTDDSLQSFVNVKPVIVADAPDAHQVWLVVGCQNFTIGEYCETKDEAEWLASQLRIALANTASQSSRGEAVYQVFTFHDDKLAWDADRAEYESRTDGTRRIVVIQPKMKLHFSRDWLKKKISSDPDVDVEAYTPAPGVVAGEVEFIAHKFWGAGEADCPKDIKSSNGELHTLRCKVCGKDNNKEPCKAAITVTDDMVDVAYEAYADMYDVEYTQGSHIDNRRACIRAALTAAIGRGDGNL